MPVLVRLPKLPEALRQGACVGQPSDDLWHPRTKGGHSAKAPPLASVIICQSCPVLRECRAYADAAVGHISGVWAGRLYVLKADRPRLPSRRGRKRGG